MKLVFRIAIIVTFPIAVFGQEANMNKLNTASDVIDAIIKKTGAEVVPNTVDVIKEGNPDIEVTGIITCMFATMDVLRKAVEKKSNLIITHEPLYYNHFDSPEQFENDEVYLAKKKFIHKNNLVIWRFHDYIHRIEPDGIITGMAKKLGWETNQDRDNPYKFSFPQITLINLLEDMKKTFPTNSFHVVGRPGMNVSTVMYVPGASGTMAQIGKLRKADVDVVVAGEVPQWETYEYVRDAIAQGNNKAIVFIGHINSEESGMQFCADWLGEFVTDIPIQFVECGASYWTY